MWGTDLEGRGEREPEEQGGFAQGRDLAEGPIKGETRKLGGEVEAIVLLRPGGKDGRL